MSTNNTQPGHTPSEPLIANNENESNIDQMLSVEIVTASLSSSVQLNSTNTIPSQTQLIRNIQEENVFIRQRLARRTQLQRRQQHQRAELRRQQEEQRRQSHQRRQQRYEVWQQYPGQRQQEREREQERGRERQLEQEEQRQREIEQARERQRESEQERERKRELELDRQRERQREREQGHYNERWAHIDLFEESTDQILTEELLYQYDSEKIERKERWEQQQLNELEGFAVIEHIASISNETEQRN